MKKCEVPDCEEFVGRRGARGLCSKHYKRYRKHGDPNEAGIRGKCTPVQLPDGRKFHRILDAARALGIAPHTAYKNISTGKQINALKRKAAGWINPQGYRMICPRGEKGAQQLEHRFVMEKRLKRKLFKHENVHHLNGQRADNRDENLELWSKSQPSGQRVEDKIAWAKGFLAEYGYTTEFLKI